MIIQHLRVVGGLLLVGLSAGCGGAGEKTAGVPASKPSILLITLDTTRADAIGPEASGVETPAFNALAARGRRFRQAYATVPETLPSHISMMTGLYPGRARRARERAARSQPCIRSPPSGCSSAGYRTGAFVSSFVLARGFGLARGFDVYDDELAGEPCERTADATTDAGARRSSTAPAISRASSGSTTSTRTRRTSRRSRSDRDSPRSRTSARSRRWTSRSAGWSQALRARVAARGGTPAIVIAGDHGEGLGDHGESQHGNLLYQSTMHVPLVIAGPGVAAGVSDTPVSTRRVFHTVLDWAGLETAHSLRGDGGEEVVLGEAMKPFLEYGWQPQIMAVDGTHEGDPRRHDRGLRPRRPIPGETQTSAPARTCRPAMRKALDDYPVPSTDVGARAGQPDGRSAATASPASATSARARRRSCARTRRGRPT